MASRRRDSSGHVDPFHQRRRRYDAILKAIGLAPTFARLPKVTQQHFFAAKFPDFSCELDPSAAALSDADEIRARLDVACRDAAFDLNGNKVLARDFLAILPALRLVILGSTPTGHSLPIQNFLDQARPIVAKLLADEVPPALTALNFAILGIIYSSSRIDTRILTLSAQSRPTENGKVHFTSIISATPPSTFTLTVDNVRRCAHRIPASVGMKPIPWLAWPREALSRNNGPLHLPLYIQSHALHRLHERVNHPEIAPYLQSWLGPSLENPVFAQSQPDASELLIEYRIHSHRLGYLIATPLADKVVIRTFKFLTMSGTPEAHKLRNRLRLTRHDLDYLGLNSLTAFTHTDLAHDPTLRRHLEACGCDHLFNFAEQTAPVPFPQPLAANMRRYLRMAA